MKYSREDLLSLAHELGYPIRSKKDLMDLESQLIINGDLPWELVEGDSDSESLEVMRKQIEDIHTSLFKIHAKKNTSEEDAVKNTMADIVFSKARKRK